MKIELKRIAVGAAIAALVAGCGSGAPEQSVPPNVSTPAAREPTPAVRTPAPAEFTGEIMQMPAGGRCFVDFIDGVLAASPTTVTRSDDVTLVGWMADSTGQVPKNARLILEGASTSYAFPLRGGVIREDVAGALKNEALKFAGYEVSLDLTGAQTGTYDLAIVMGGGDPYACMLSTKMILSN